MEERAPDAPAGSAAEPSRPAGPPVLPAPFAHRYLGAGTAGSSPSSTCSSSTPPATREAEETVGVSAWPLGGATAAEALEAERFEVAEGEVERRAALRRCGTGPSRSGSPTTRRGTSRRRFGSGSPTDSRSPCSWTPTPARSPTPGESRGGLRAPPPRVEGGKAAEKVRARLEKKKATLALREEEVEGRRQEKWFAIGKTVLKMTGLLGRRRSASGIDSVLTKNRLEDQAEARLEAIRAEVADLERELDEIVDVDSGSLEEKTLRPARGGVKVLRYDLVWVY